MSADPGPGRGAWRQPRVLQSGQRWRSRQPWWSARRFLGDPHARRRAGSLSAIAGPALGGVLYGWSPSLLTQPLWSWLAAATLAVAGIRKVDEPRPREAATLESLAGGFRFMLREKVVLGASSLDLFAVLLGSAVALLPIFAPRHSGSRTDRSRPIARRHRHRRTADGDLPRSLSDPPPRPDGSCSRPLQSSASASSFRLLALDLWLSVAALIVMGASDMISVYIREVLVQLWTPDALRGRVNAVYMLMITARMNSAAFAPASRPKRSASSTC